MRLEFGGIEFDLKPPTLNELVAMEDAGISFEDLRKGSIKMVNLRTILHIILKAAGVVSATPEGFKLTPEWVGSHIAINDMADEGSKAKQILDFFSSSKAASATASG